MRRAQSPRPSTSTLLHQLRWLLCGLLLVGGVLLAGVPAAGAYQAPGVPHFEVEVQPDGSARVLGYGWGEDTGVDVTLNGTSLGVTAVDNGMFTRPLATEPSAGDAFVLTGAQSQFTRDMTVENLAVTRFGLADDSVAGTKGDAPGWGDLSIWLGNMWQDVYLQQQVPADGSTEFAVSLTKPYDQMHGVGLSLRQNDADGDTLIVSESVPRPALQVQSNAATLSGWTPGSTVTVHLDDDTAGEYPYSYEVTVDAQGDSECCEPPPAQEWRLLLPGFRAKAVGDVARVDDGTVVKEIVVPAPADVPVPSVTGTVVSGSVGGVLSDSAVGSGSTVEVTAFCGAGQNAWRADDVTGAYAFDFAAAAQQPYGERTCDAGSPPFLAGVIARDLDGDEYDASWFASSMFDAAHPALAVETPVAPGTSFRVDGTGWDMTVIDLQLCEVVDVGGEPGIGECDDTTLLRTHSYPVQDGSWPAGMAVLEEYMVPSGVIFVGAGDREVDCAAAPGTCAVVGTELLRPDVTAWAPLEIMSPVALDVELATKGTVSTVTGKATISGTVSASESTWVHVSGEVTQRLGRTRLVVGGFDTWVYVEAADTPVAWSAIATPWTGQAFGSGFAGVEVWVDLGEDGLTDGDHDVATVKLSTQRRR